MIEIRLRNQTSNIQDWLKCRKTWFLSSCQCNFLFFRFFGSTFPAVWLVDYCGRRFLFAGNFFLILNQDSVYSKNENQMFWVCRMYVCVFFCQSVPLVCSSVSWLLAVLVLDLCSILKTASTMRYTFQKITFLFLTSRIVTMWLFLNTWNFFFFKRLSAFEYSKFRILKFSSNLWIVKIWILQWWDLYTFEFR